jgi:hypothetical protein
MRQKKKKKERQKKSKKKENKKKTKKTPKKTNKIQSHLSIGLLQLVMQKLFLATSVSVATGVPLIFIVSF